MKQYVAYIVLALLLTSPLLAQEAFRTQGSTYATVDRGDTIPYVKLPPITVLPPYQFKNKKQEEQYWRMVRDVKKVLPIAKMVRGTLIETYHVLETIPSQKEREKHLKAVEKQMLDDYKPQMKRLTLRQGKLLIRLVDRYCNQSSYEVLKAYLGGFRAGFWQAFATLFGASLKTEWDPAGKDKMLEHIVTLVEAGAL